MKNTLQITYWTVGGFEGSKPVEQAMREAKEMGFDGLELAFGAGCLAPGVSETRCREIRREAGEMGLKIETLASGAYWQKPLSSPDPAVREEAVEFTREYLQVAAWIGARAVLVIPGVVAVPWDPKTPPVTYATAWKNAAASIRKLAPLAEKLRVTIALENVWNWFLADPVAMREFVDLSGSRRVGIYLDVGNTLINGFPEHWIEILGRRIAAVHVKNFSRQDCGGTLHGFGDDLMKGDADWPAILAALKKIHYAGPVTAEMLPFSRLPDMKLPDLDLARDTAGKLRRIMEGKS